MEVDGDSLVVYCSAAAEPRKRTVAVEGFVGVELGRVPN